MANSLLKLKNVSKFYYNKGLVASGFTKVSLELNMGEFVVITGESGSGKSTLLNVISGLDTYEEGEMYINGKETSHYTENDFEKYRRTYIGNIFQSFNLVNSYTVYQNIELVLLLNGYKKKEIKEKILDLIKSVDLYKYRNTKVSHLSGGQKQRVAIARALAKDTPIIIADEPTGNLDSRSAKSVLQLLSEIAKDKLVIVVTHNFDQVEEYATRKIEMHDGRIREDRVLKDHKQTEAKLTEFKDIRFINKVGLGIRNTFNIFIKFVLTLIVFLFVILSILGTYSSFRHGELEEATEGYSSVFNNNDINKYRIVLQKKDRSAFSEAEIEELSKIKNVNKVVKNDALLDSYYFLVSDDDRIQLSGNVKSISEIDKVDVGRLPENDNEIVLKTNENDYYYYYNKEELLDYTYHIMNEGWVRINETDYTVVGIITTKGFDYSIYLYLSDNTLETLDKNINYQYSSKIMEFKQGKQINEHLWDNYMSIYPSNKVSKGYALVDENINYFCKNYSCKNDTFKITVKNIYFEKEMSLKISNTYSKNSYTKLTGLERYDLANGAIYISNEDYDTLFNDGYYQIAIIADEARYVDGIKNSIPDEYKALAIKDNLYNGVEEIIAVIRIFKVVVLTVLLVVLFFISYFVIKLIQKSKNIYYSTVRILGGTVQNVKDLIKIELLTIFHVAFMIVIIFILLNRCHIININYISELTDFLYLKDYVFIYAILLVLSYLLAYRYSYKLFKSSAMQSYREEV